MRRESRLTKEIKTDSNQSQISNLDTQIYTRSLTYWKKLN